MATSRARSQGMNSRATRIQGSKTEQGTMMKPAERREFTLP